MKSLKLISLLTAAVLSAGILAGCGAASSAAPASQAASAASAVSSAAASSASAAIEVTFTVTGKDNSVTQYALSAGEGDTLASALLAAGLISEEEASAGFVTTVNGVTADYDADGAYWMLVDKDGGMTSVGISDITLADGDSYGFTYTVG